MTNEEYYSNYKVMFQSEGWAQLQEELKKEIYEIQADALEAKSWEIVNQMRGKAEAFTYLTNLPTILESLQKDEKDNADVQLSLQGM